jgi:hypothetical protein
MSAWFTKNVLNAIERWADGMVLIRETGALIQNARMDAILLPIDRNAHCMRRSDRPFFTRPGILAVEVKTERSDFLRGLRTGQFEKYQACVHGLYLATTLDIAKTSEVPGSCGHLVVDFGGKLRRTPIAVCKRHPRYNDKVMYDTETMWRIFFALVAAQSERFAWQQEDYRRKLQQIGHIAGEKVFMAIRRIQETVEQR